MGKSRAVRPYCVGAIKRALSLKQKSSLQSSVQQQLVIVRAYTQARLCAVYYSHTGESTEHKQQPILLRSNKSTPNYN
jgi:hypothetical protein